MADDGFCDEGKRLFWTVFWLQNEFRKHLLFEGADYRYVDRLATEMVDETGLIDLFGVNHNLSFYG